MNDTYASRRAHALIKGLRQHAFPDEPQAFVSAADAKALLEKVLTVKKSIAVDDVTDLLRTLLLPEWNKPRTHPFASALIVMREEFNKGVNKAALKLGIKL